MAYLDYKGKTDMNNGHCYSDPLRLRGGGDEDDDNENVVDMTDAEGNSGDMVPAGGSQKRGPPSPVAQSSKQPRTVYRVTDHRELNDLLGWLEQTVIQEKGKKLGVQVSEKMLSKLARLRVVTTGLTHDNSKLQGELKGKEDTQRMSLTCFIDKLDAKNAEANSLKAELDTLRKAGPAPSKEPVPRPTYADKAASAPKATVATAPKTIKAKEKEQLKKSRKVKATSRFMVEIPKDMTVATAKAGLWETVRTKIKNPRAKTIVSGKSLIIIPDDANTLEVMKDLKQAIEISPRKPRLILYDVESGITGEELAECLLGQNPELGLTAEDVGCMTPLHKLGPRDGHVVHWVIEAPANVVSKLENRSIYIGMTRCRCKVHSSTPQCYNCQQYGHTSLRCEQKEPTCRHCAGAHDSRECKNEVVKCANCKGPHKASSATCRAKTQATRSLLRRTDFGQQ
ncbi:unnamed protein product [Macrosiphum euphorbiae]|nr:unnamed protein product [Macrosiphum euphorbiae]